MRLVDADTLPVKFWYGRFFGVAEIDIVNAPTVDAEPVRHGYWIPVDDKYDAFDCSECKRLTMVHKPFPYCPICGARMNEVKE